MVKGTYGSRVGRPAGPAGMPVQCSPWAGEGGLGYADAVGGGLGDGHGLGLQAGSAGR